MKSFYEEDGVTWNEAGKEANKMLLDELTRFYEYWINQGYHPSECLEMLMTKVFHVSSLCNIQKYTE